VRAPRANVTRVDADAFTDEEWRAQLHRAFDDAAASLRRREPRATSAQIEPTVHQMGQDALDAWRNPRIPAGAGRNTAWEAQLHDSLDAGVAAVRELDPTAAESGVEALVRQGAQAALDSWRIGS
jgi:hypothetical protein